MLRSMSRASLLLLPLLLTVACAVRLPPTPDVQVQVESLVRSELPGGSLRVLHVATTRGREKIVVQGGGNDLLELPVFVYLFEHPTEGPVLIDTGFGRRTAQDPYDYPGRTATRALRITMEEGAAIADRLPEVGHSVDEVRHIVVTHMHSDHIGGLEDFPRAALWVARAEWEAADEPGPLGKPDPRPYANHAVVRLVDFTATPAYGVFPAHIDLFGDGSLILLPAPGHTPGHTAVLLNLVGGSFLFTGDAAWIDRHWQGPELKGNLVRNLLEDDWELNWISQWRINAWAAAMPELTIIAGHERANLERLRQWPEAYE